MLFKCCRESTIEEVCNLSDRVLSQSAKNVLSKSLLDVLVADELLVLAQKDSNLARAHVRKVEFSSIDSFFEQTDC